MKWRHEDNNKGSAMIELELLISLIAVVALPSVAETGDRVKCKFEDAEIALNGRTRPPKTPC